MYQRNIGIRIGGPITPGVKLIMIINIIVFIIQKFADIIMSDPHLLEYTFGISHPGLFTDFMIWQPLTYMFLHGGWAHIIFNLIGLWMFAGELEIEWGRKRFIKYYILSGIGAGLFIALMNYIAYTHYGSTPVTIGASGAIYAILLAYAMRWPNREVLFFFLIPIKMKYLVLIFGVLEFYGTLSTATGAGGNISHIGHLGGIITGFFLVNYMMKSKSQTKKSGSFFERLNKKSRLNNKKNIIDSRIKAKRIIDTLLEKIARDGMNSLTPEEKKSLEWARKNYYYSNNDTLH
ncbi:MAG: rhomboid family intramembrane serine protease [Spirochaetes bacterium]|nr:rhomboid family intramembrane serine protease [Spirochaetota bacterium]